jgi:choline dehydrogenase
MNRFTEPIPSLNNRRVYAPRGKTLGGSSAINGMAYVRGNAVDYDSWRQLGNVGWSYADVLPYFKKIERRAGGDPAFRSETGPLSITDPLVQHSTSKDFVEAGIRFGLPRNPDYNGAYQEGASFLQQNIRDGRRHSVADAFLMPARRRPNLEVITDAHVQNIAFEGRRAVAVNYERGGVAHSISADREIILSAGSLNSPKLLMLSGVGPAQELKAMGLPVVADSPGVGKNLQDHLYINYRARSQGHSSINRELRGLRRYMHGLHYILTHRGMLTMTGTQAAAFIRVMPGRARPTCRSCFGRTAGISVPQGGLRFSKNRRSRRPSRPCGRSPAARSA